MCPPCKTAELAKSGLSTSHWACVFIEYALLPSGVLTNRHSFKSMDDPSPRFSASALRRACSIIWRLKACNDECAFVIGIRIRSFPPRKPRDPGDLGSTKYTTLSKMKIQAPSLTSLSIVREASMVYSLITFWHMSKRCQSFSKAIPVDRAQLSRKICRSRTLRIGREEVHVHRIRKA